MTQWPKVSELQLNKLSKSGLYESYYFRANAPDGSQAVWIKHNLLQFSKSEDVIIELWIIYYSKQQQKPTIIKQEIKMSFEEFCQSSLFKARDLNQFDFRNGNNFSKISEKNISGKLIEDAEKSASWDLTLTRSTQHFYHLAPAKLYHIGFPKKKILTADCHINLDGKLKINDKEIDLTNWHGIIGHNWGKEHAYLYLYASCNMFQEDTSAYFDGFSAKIKIAGITTPFLSCGGLYTNGNWYHFTNITQALKHKILQFGEHTWEVEYISASHKLNVLVREVLPPNESDKLWAALPYHHPSRKISIIKSSKLTSCKLTLTEIKSGKVLTTLTSSAAELETCIPK